MKRLALLGVLLMTALANGQVPNSDCGEVWVVYFRCVADSTCGAGRKFCTWVFQSEFCGGWDARGCYP